MGSAISHAVDIAWQGDLRVDVEPRISIVIPTRNGGPRLGSVLESIAAQGGPLRPEVLAVDSGSTDGTIECLHAYNARVLNVPAGTFNHGQTRNEALSAAGGDYAVLLVQDAVPASRNWLSALLKPLQEDPSIAGTFARQLPAEDASLVTSHYLSNWIAAQHDARIVGPLTADAFARMSPSERHATCAFDNVCSCIRLSVWREHPFATTPIAEDLQWARDVLCAGYKLAYVPDAVVSHSHERSVQYELQRTYLVHQRLHDLFGLSTVPTMGSLLRAVAVTIPVNARIALDEPQHRVRALLRGAALGVAQPLGQYLGARSSREKRELLRTGVI
jgi:glycosyltransferase involved in cell wall biosynthesis